MANLEQAGKDIATKLDAGNFDEASSSLQQFRQDLSRDDFKQLIKNVDKNEKDDDGFDIVVKYDRAGDPKHYSVINKDTHASAKQMAELMDSGRTADATELLQKVATEMDKAAGGNAQEVQKKFSLWAMAVDAYDKDGVGSDVHVDVTKPGLTGIEWNFQQPKK